MAETPGDIPTPRKPRWYAPTPAKFLFAVLLMQGVLFLSAHYRWFWFNERKGYTVLITVAATAVALLLLAAIVLVSRFTKQKAQFGLTTILLTIPVMALPCGWLTREMEQARQQEDVVKLASLVATNPPWVAKTWLTDHLGVEFFRDLTSVEFFPEFSPTDADLLKFKRLTRLRQLYLNDSQITDAGLEHLKGLTQLERLRLDGTSVSDAGLVHLKGLTQLELLNLNDTQVTDTGLAHLHALSKLHILGLDRTAISDAGLEHLAGLTQLRSLFLERTPITDAGLKHLKGLSDLQFLYLGRTKVTTIGAERIKVALPRCRVSR